MEIKGKIKCFFDGACWPNPGGKAGYGWAVLDDGYFQQQGSGVIGQGAAMSNNVAEYYAFYYCLENLKKMGLNKNSIEIYGDSKLVVEQMNGRWRVKKGLYVDAFKKAYCMLKEFSKTKVIWIPREENNLADYLSKKAIGEPRWLKELSAMDSSFRGTIKG